MDSAGLLGSFESKRELYETFAQTVSNLISRLLGADGVAMHSVSFRCKTLNSFKVKVEKKNRYGSLEQITDLAGVRLITHYEDDVDKVARIIESEFLVDAENSIDKRKALDPDRFGYLSLHYVVSLKGDRSKLKEYRAFKGLKAEIQVRSLLQHTWAEIEHDTGYKSTVEVPKHIRRRFSRLAGLLELADQEFIGIRTALDEYSLAVEAQLSGIPEKEDEPLDVLIDRVSLEQFIKLNPLVAELDAKICSLLGTTCGADLKHALDDVKRLRAVGVETLGELKAALEENQELIIARAEQIVGLREQVSTFFDRKFQLRYAISVLYLLQVLAARSGGVSEIGNMLKKMGLSDNEQLPEMLKQLIDATARSS